MSIVGKTFESNTSGEFTVLKKDGRQGTNQLYLIEFVETRYQTHSTKRHIKGGGIRDPYYPSICGVACMGNTTSREDGGKKKSYVRWKEMIKRCFNEDHKRYDDWGGRGISVCERWLCFENYEEDVKKLEGFDDPAKNTIDRIDNDGNYTPDNCRWASYKTQNANTRSRRQFVAFPQDNKHTTYMHSNQHQFARDHDLTQPNINQCLNGHQKTHKGWRFTYLEDFLDNGAEI